MNIIYQISLLVYELTFSFFLLPMILSKPLNAPDDMNKTFVVSTATISPLTFRDLSERWTQTTHVNNICILCTVLIVRYLTRHLYNGSFKYFKKTLLYSFTSHISQMMKSRYTTYLVYFVQENNPLRKTHTHTHTHKTT